MYSRLLIIRAGQRQQLGLTNRTEDCRKQLHWGAGLQGCRKASDHPDPEDQKVEEVHMFLWIWKGFVFSSYRETVAQMIEENLNCLGHLSTIIHEANEEQGSSMMVSFIWIWVCVLGLLDTASFKLSMWALFGIWNSRGELKKESIWGISLTSNPSSLTHGYTSIVSALIFNSSIFGQIKWRVNIFLQCDHWNWMVCTFLLQHSIFSNKMEQDLYYKSNLVTTVCKMNDVNIAVINRSIYIKIWLLWIIDLLKLGETIIKMFTELTLLHLVSRSTLCISSY